MARRPRSSPPTAPAAYTSIRSRASSATLHAKLAGAPPKRGPSGKTSHNISPMPMTVARRVGEKFTRSMDKLRKHHHFTEKTTKRRSCQNAHHVGDDHDRSQVQHREWTSSRKASRPAQMFLSFRCFESSFQSGGWKTRSVLIFEQKTPRSVE